MTARQPGAVHELPADLPQGEHVLWQGAPAVWPLARALHIRLAAGYFAALLAWYAADRLVKAQPGFLASFGRLAVLACVAVALFAAYAWLVSRMTSYTFTNRRLILQIGIALPISFNIPFSRIAAAGMTQRADGSGDIVISLLSGERLGYVVLWPHARPWRFAQAQPMLRGVAEVDRVSRILSQLLAASLEGTDSRAAVTAAPEPAGIEFGPITAAA